jgi:hypothetical protein
LLSLCQARPVAQGPHAEAATCGANALHAAVTPSRCSSRLAVPLTPACGPAGGAPPPPPLLILGGAGGEAAEGAGAAAVSGGDGFDGSVCMLAIQVGGRKARPEFVCCVRYSVELCLLCALFSRAAAVAWGRALRRAV